MSNQFDRLVGLMAKLRAPDGCPWDRKQTHASLKPYLLEETYEVLEAIDHQDTSQLKEELGDLLLQILFHSQIGSEAGAFTVYDVMGTLADKLVRRHPHVFGPSTASSESLHSDEVYAKWEEIKRQERREAGRQVSALDGVPSTLPALLRVYQLQARASRVGFDWPQTDEGLEQIFEKIREEVAELRQALGSTQPSASPSRSGEPPGARSEEIESELGDVLFSLVNLSRRMKVNPEDALRQAANRFSERFHFIESQAARSGRAIEELSLEEMDGLWEEAKGKPKTEPRS